MKKYISISFMLFTVFCILGCSENKNQIDDKLTTKKIPWSSVTKYEYDGHRYIKFKECCGYDGYAGVVHDPDCICFSDTIIKDTVIIENM